MEPTPFWDRNDINLVLGLIAVGMVIFGLSLFGTPLK